MSPPVFTAGPRPDAGPPKEPDPEDILRGTGRTTRMLEKAKRLAESQSVVVVCHSLRMADDLRARFSRMEPLNTAYRVRFASAPPPRESYEYALWDHHARDVRIAELEREIVRLREVDVGQ